MGATSINVSTIHNVSPEKPMVHTNANAPSRMKENSANSKIKWSDLKEIKELMRKEGREIKTASETRAENGLKNARSKSTGIISSKNTVAGQKDLIKWPNVLGPTLQSLVTLLAFQQKLKQEKSNLSPDGTSSRKEVEI